MARRSRCVCHHSLDVHASVEVFGYIVPQCLCCGCTGNGFGVSPSQFDIRDFDVEHFYPRAV